MSAQRYVHNILQSHVLPLIQRLSGTIFQQDNAQPHTAKMSQDCLRTVTTPPWTARSPDWSPIEHIWAHLGRLWYSRLFCRSRKGGRSAANQNIDRSFSSHSETNQETRDFEVRPSTWGTREGHSGWRRKASVVECAANRLSERFEEFQDNQPRRILVGQHVEKPCI
ncbi:transposable element Tcb1 transposase [Trichonephila clavipes]|nr:transposable element Tcb1 transposase [Trichonephila clavipes]